MAKGRVLTEFWQFLKQEKKYWLMPIVIVFVLIERMVPRFAVPSSMMRMPTRRVTVSLVSLANFSASA